MKLKTLKDLKINEGCGKCRDKTKPYSSEQLKQEAIKHINYIKTHKPYIEWEMVEVIDPEAKPLLKKCLTYEGQILIDWIRYFFNIKGI